MLNLTALTCKEFSRHVAGGVEPIRGGFYRRLQFLTHWLICEYCRRYWKELRALGRLQRREARRRVGGDLPALKERLRGNLKGRQP